MKALIFILTSFLFLSCTTSRALLTDNEVFMKIAHLKYGDTAYDIVNPNSSKTVLFLHGGTLPSWTFDKVFEDLKNEGYRLIRYDMYGRGQSAAPLNVRYDRNLYLFQLEDLLKTLQVKKLHAIVGSSFGAAISTLFTLRHPSVEKLIFISPAINWKNNNGSIKVFTKPVIGRLAYDLVGKKEIRKRALGFIDTLPQEDAQKYRQLVLKQFDSKNKGFWESLYSQICSDALDNYTDKFKELGQQQKNKPVYVISGDNDKEVPLSDIEMLKRNFTDIQIQIVPGATHGLQAEEPELLNTFLRNALRH